MSTFSKTKERHRDTIEDFLKKASVTGWNAKCDNASQCSYVHLQTCQKHCQKKIRVGESLIKHHIELALKENPNLVFYRFMWGIIWSDPICLERLAEDFYNCKKYKEAVVVATSLSQKHNASLVAIRDKSFKELCRECVGNVKSSIDLINTFYFYPNKDLLVEYTSGILPVDVAYEYYKDLARYFATNSLEIEIIKLLRLKYPENKAQLPIQVERVISESTSLPDRIRNYERRIKYVKDAFVLHDTWGLGRIDKIDYSTFTIVFRSSKIGTRTMSHDIAYRSLTVLPKTHVMVLKACIPDELRKRVLKDPRWAFRMLIKSYEGCVTLAEVRRELEGSIITNYFCWIQNAIEEVNSDPHFIQVSKNGKIGFAYSEQLLPKDEINTDLPIIPPNISIHIVPQNFPCISKGHKLKSFYTYIPVKSQKGILIKKTYIDYCQACRKFYISDIEFSHKFGGSENHLLRCFIQPDGSYYGPQPETEISSFREESALKQAGYSVAKQDGLTPEERQQILDEVILYGIMDVQAVKSYLQFFISYLGKNPNMEDAVDNWMIDLNYLNSKYSESLSVFLRI